MNLKYLVMPFYILVICCFTISCKTTGKNDMNQQLEKNSSSNTIVVGDYIDHVGNASRAFSNKEACFSPQGFELPDAKKVVKTLDGNFEVSEYSGTYTVDTSNRILRFKGNGFDLKLATAIQQLPVISQNHNSFSQTTSGKMIVDGEDTAITVAVEYVVYFEKLEKYSLSNNRMLKNPLLIKTKFAFEELTYGNAVEVLYYSIVEQYGDGLVVLDKNMNVTKETDYCVNTDQLQ